MRLRTNLLQNRFFKMYLLLKGIDYLSQNEILHKMSIPPTVQTIKLAMNEMNNPYVPEPDMVPIRMNAFWEGLCSSTVLDDHSSFGRHYCSHDYFDRILVSIF